MCCPRNGVRDWPPGHIRQPDTGLLRHL